MEKQSKAKEKMNLNFAPEIKEYLIVEADKFGMSVSAYLTMLVCVHRKQQEENVIAMSNVNNLLKEIERLMGEKKVAEKC